MIISGQQLPDQTVPHVSGNGRSQTGSIGVGYQEGKGVYHVDPGLRRRVRLQTSPAAVIASKDTLGLRYGDIFNEILSAAYDLIKPSIPPIPGHLTGGKGAKQA